MNARPGWLTFLFVTLATAPLSAMERDEKPKAAATPFESTRVWAVHVTVPAREWERATRQAFLQAYRDGTQGSPLYGSWDDMRQLIDLFEVDKAFYELGYEVDNRPDWVRVPLAGLKDLGISK